MQLTADERHFLETSTDVRKQFEAADKAIGEAAVLSMAASGSAKGAAAAGAAAGGASTR